MTNEEFELFDNTEQQSSLDVRELICCETIRAVGYTLIACTPATGTLFITDDNPGFISGQTRMRGKNEGRYPFHYLEMIDIMAADDYTMGWARVSHRPIRISVLVHQPIFFRV